MGFRCPSQRVVGDSRFVSGPTTGATVVTCGFPLASSRCKCTLRLEASLYRSGVRTMMLTDAAARVLVVNDLPLPLRVGISVLMSPMVTLKLPGGRDLHSFTYWLSVSTFARYKNRLREMRAEAPYIHSPTFRHDVSTF